MSSTSGRISFLFKPKSSNGRAYVTSKMRSKRCHTGTILKGELLQFLPKLVPALLAGYAQVRFAATLSDVTV